MDLLSARGMKSEIRRRLNGLLTQPGITSRLNMAARRAQGAVIPRSVALGISKVNDEFKIAVRLQHPAPVLEELLREIRTVAGAETEIRYVGRISKRQLPQQLPQRPLRIGCSIGHFQITAGTLGAFVKSRSGVGGPLILSNNHVLADENRAQIGDPILQPGLLDGGTVPVDVVGNLVSFEPLNPSVHNVVDCAVASINAGLGIVSNLINGIGPFRGRALAPPQALDRVSKTGRSTGTTTAQITAIEVDNAVVDFDIGSIPFDNQIEIDSADANGFSADGDSGSLVVNANGEAIGLLFAASDTGGVSDFGLTYVNPIDAVLNALNCDFLI